MKKYNRFDPMENLGGKRFKCIAIEENHKLICKFYNIPNQVKKFHKRIPMEPRIQLNIMYQRNYNTMIIYKKNPKGNIYQGLLG